MKLELTKAEVAALFILTGTVSGNPKNSPRGITDALYERLRNLMPDDLTDLEESYWWDVVDVESSIKFLDYDCIPEKMSNLFQDNEETK